MALELPKLEVWQWGAVIVGGIGVGLAIRYMRDRKGGGSGEASDENAAATAELQAIAENLNSQPLPGTATGPYAGWTAASEAPPSSTAQTTIFSTNDEWAREVAMALGRTGRFDFIAVDQALNNYLNGIQLDDQEYAIVDLAIRTYGYPPILPGYPQRKPAAVVPVVPTQPTSPNVGRQDQGLPRTGKLPLVITSSRLPTTQR